VKLFRKIRTRKSQANFQIEFRHSSMNKPRKPAQVHCRATERRLVRIRVSRVVNVPREQQALDDARFARAVWAEDEGDRAERNLLRGAEGFEIGDGKGREHRVRHYCRADENAAMLKTAGNMIQQSDRRVYKEGRFESALCLPSLRAAGSDHGGQRFGRSTLDDLSRCGDCGSMRRGATASRGRYQIAPPWA
jgi:hypothetical protein